jgi:hypothetical protein
MNTRKVSTTVTWTLELTDREDSAFQYLLEYMQEYSDFPATRELCKKLLLVCPKEGGDEKTSNLDDDLDFDLSVDDFDRRNAIHDATMGVPTDATRLSKLADTCRGGGSGEKPEDFDQSARRSAQSEWDKGRV